MLSSPPNPLGAGIEAVVVAAFFLVLGWLIADALLGRRGLDAIACWGLAFSGVGVYALLLMLLHIASGGRVFANPWLTRGITLGVFAALALRRGVARRRGAAPGRPARRAALAAAGMVVAGLLVWGSPVARELPLDVRGDSILHSGWSSQLLDGETTPSASITGAVPNFYPWLSHALLALLARFTPGGRTLHAFGPLQVLQVSGAMLALFALGRALDGSVTTGAAAGLLGGLTGGVGFVALRGLDLVMNPRLDPLRYLGDLLYKRSYNISFYDLAPSFPRDVAWTLLVGCLLLLVQGLRSDATFVLVASGVVLGLVGLTGAESFFVGFGAVVAMTILPAHVARRRLAGCVLLPALGVYALWVVPQVLSYLRLGGYVNLTVVGPVTLPAWAILISWGILTPLAAVGVASCLPRARDDVVLRLVGAVTVVAGATVLAATIVPAVLGRAFLSLGRPHRYWPLLCFGVALLAALGVARVLAWASRGPRWMVPAVVVVVVGLALPSPVVASLALSREHRHHGLFEAAVRGDPAGLLNLVSPAAGGRCQVAVPLSLDSQVWAYSGYRLVAHRGRHRRPGNGARIRWRDIYEHITPPEQRLRDNRLLTNGSGSRARWDEVAAAYGVDVVVVPNARSYRPALRGRPRAAADDAPFTVFRLSRCGT